MIRLLLFLLLAVALAGYAHWVYLRGELAVRSRGRLALLRTSILVLLLALLFDPPLPWGGALRAPPRWALLDVSLSMGAGGGGAWLDARRRAAELAEDGWTVVAFGAGLEGVDTSAVEPWAPRTDLASALLRAAEAGVQEVRVLSDLRFGDPVEAGSVMASTGLGVTFEPMGSSVVNAGLGGFTVADQARRMDPVTAEVELFAQGVADSVLLEVREEGRLVLSQAFPAPAPGRRGRWEVALPPPAGEGRQRYAASVHVPGDGFPSDDEAVAYMMAGHVEGGLVLVSFRPDWDARALLPVLGEATGLPATGYLRVGPDRFSPMGTAVQRRPPVDSAGVRRAALAADLLVVHGVDAHTDAWGRFLAAARGGRVVVWPLDGAGGDALRFPVGISQAGEWYASPEIPASPLAGDLAGARLQDLPPFTSLLLSQAQPEGRWAPLMVQLRGVGPAQPALVLESSSRGRRAVVLASGLWRWAARDGAAKDAYRSLWSGVAGWLLTSDAGSAAPEVRPERWVTPRGEELRWWIPGAAGDSVRLRVLADSVPVLDTVVGGGGTVGTGVLPPGTYSFTAEGPGPVVGAGRLDVEVRTDELFPRAQTLEGMAADVAPGNGATPGGAPLRTRPWPYLVLMLLLFAEWVARRRVGLR